MKKILASLALLVCTFMPLSQAKAASPPEVTNLDLSKGNSETYNITKLTVNTIGLIDNIQKGEAYANALNRATESIEKLNTIQKNLDIKIGNQNWAKHLRSFGKTSESKKAVDTMSNTISKLQGDKALTSKNIKLLTGNLTKIPKTGKLLSPSLKGVGSELKGKAVGLGTVVTVIEVTNDLLKKQERISQGSTETLENLNIALKIVENFGPPTIPGTKSPSDVARAIIDFQASLKSRNASLVSGNTIMRNGTESFIAGDASIEAYLVRKSNNESYIKRTKEIGINESYAETRAEYMKMYSGHMKNLYATKTMLEQLRSNEADDILVNNDEVALYNSLIGGINQSIGHLAEKSKDIWQNNLGLELSANLYDLELAKQDLISSINVINSEKKSYDDLIQSLPNAINSIESTIFIDTSTVLQPKRAIFVPTELDEDKSIFLSGTKEEEKKIESHVWVNPNIKPTQAELEEKSKEQLQISSKLASSNKSINALNSQLQNKKEELRRLESQGEHNTAQQQNNVNLTDIEKAKQKFQFFFQAYVVSKKYNGDLSNISGKDLVKLKILSKNTFGTAREWKNLFRDSRSLLNNQKHTYESLKREYNQQIQQQRASVQNSNRIAQLRERISQLEQDIIPKQRANTDYQIQKHEIDFTLMNLTDSINDDNKVILAKSQDPTLTEYWQGFHTRNYYNDDSGNPIFYGYGDAEAETKEIKPGNGSTLYLPHADSQHPEDDRTKTLSESEASYFGNYTYTAWGTWSAPNATQKVYTSHWVVLAETPDIDLPTQGSATYTGELAGGQYTLGQTGYNAVNGNITLNANFGSRTITGDISIKNASTGAVWGTASIDNGSMDGNYYQGQLIGAGISNTEAWHSQIQGEFGGNDASETGGMWAVTKGTGANGDERAVGVFRAKKQ